MYICGMINRVLLAVCVALLFVGWPAAGAEEGAQRRARYETAVAVVAARRAARAGRLRLRGEQAARLTARRPIDITLRDGQTLRACRIAKLGARQLTVSGSENASRTLAWSALAPESYIRVMALGLSASDGPGFRELYRYCILHGRHDAAARALRQLTQINPKHGLPAVASFRRAPAFSSGKVLRRGESLRVSYGFDSPAEQDEFTRDFLRRGQAREMWTDGGKLRFMSDLMIPFPEWVSSLRFPGVVRLTPGQQPQGSHLWIHLSYRKGVRDHGLYLIINRDLTRYASAESARSDLQVLEMLGQQVENRTLALKAVVGQPSRVEIRLARKSIVVVLGETVVLKAVGEFSNPLFSFGGLSTDANARLRIRDISISGQLSPARYRAALREKRLARLRGLFKIEGEAFASAPELEARHEAALKVDTRQRYAQLRKVIERFLEDDRPQTQRAVRQSLNAYIAAEPTSPLGYFWRGWFRALFSEAEPALRDLDRAISRDPKFIAAHAARSRELLALGLLLPAQAAARQTIALAPDNARGRATMALVAFARRQDLAQARIAIDALEVATLLSPADAELALDLRQCREVVAGPLWPGGSPPPMTRGHYTLFTDLPAAQRAMLSRELMRIHGVFEKFLPPSGQPIGRARVYLFASRAAYEISSALIGSEVEPDTEGHFERTFKNLYLYRSHDDIDTGKLENTVSTLRHEAWHQYVSNLIPNLPAWADEALGEHFSTIRFAGGTQRVGLQRERLKTIADWVLRAPHMPFKQMMHCSEEAFASYEVAYSQAWSMIYLFLVHDPAQYRAPLMRYLSLLRGGQSREQSYAATFGQLDMSAVEQAWKKMLRSLVEKLKEN